MELQSAEVAHEPPRPRGKRRTARAWAHDGHGRAGPDSRGGAWGNSRATLSRRGTAYLSRDCPDPAGVCTACI